MFTIVLLFLILELEGFCVRWQKLKIKISLCIGSVSIEDVSPSFLGSGNLNIPRFHLGQQFTEGQLVFFRLHGIEKDHRFMLDDLIQSGLQPMTENLL